jgi:hypothetical protein
LACTRSHVSVSADFAQRLKNMIQPAMCCAGDEKPRLANMWPGVCSCRQKARFFQIHGSRVLGGPKNTAAGSEGTFGSGSGVLLPPTAFKDEKSRERSIWWRRIGCSNSTSDGGFPAATLHSLDYEGTESCWGNDSWVDWLGGWIYLSRSFPASTSVLFIFSKICKTWYATVDGAGGLGCSHSVSDAKLSCTRYPGPW